MVDSRSTLPPPAETSTSGRSIDLTPTAAASTTDADKAREGILARLIFASRDLADHQFIRRGGYRLCTDCGVWQVEDKDAHPPVCRTGRVLALLDDLANLQLSTERSASRDDSFPAAAAEERPRGFDQFVAGVDQLFQKYGFVPKGMDPETEQLAQTVRERISEELADDGAVVASEGGAQ